MNSKKETNLNNKVKHKILHKNLNFAAAEAYKLLRTNLAFTLSDKSHGCRVIGVTSSIRSEGKSVTSVNLSYSLAESGKKVLLIDADMRLPTVGKKMDMANSPGLSNILVAGDGELSFEGSKSVPVVAGGSLPLHSGGNGLSRRSAERCVASYPGGGGDHPGAGRHYQSVLAQEEKGR